jgi:hypothetical protein
MSLTDPSPGLTTFRVIVHPSETTVTVQAPSAELASVLAVDHVDGVRLSGFLAQRFTTVETV